MIPLDDLQFGLQHLEQKTNKDLEKYLNTMRKRHTLMIFNYPAITIKDGDER